MKGSGLDHGYRRAVAAHDPRASGQAPEQADLRACRRLLRHGSRTFFLSSFLLPSEVRRAASALYAFCRTADDAVDLVADSSAAVPRLRERLAAVYDEKPADHPVDRALHRVVDRYRIPRELFDLLLEGLAWDADRRQYETLSDLRTYAVRVAGVVGAMMSVLMGVRSESALGRAFDLGVAMQLTNIARDVGEDARAGRLYLPRAWMREAGLDPDAWLARPVHDAALASVVSRLLDEADRLYLRAGGGIAELPFGCRPGINASRLVYREIGVEVARRGFDALSGRAVVPGPRKLRMLAGAMAGGMLSRAPARPGRRAAPGSREDAKPMAEARHAVEATIVSPGPAGAGRLRVPRGHGLGARVEWTLMLFEDLARQDLRPHPARRA